MIAGVAIHQAFKLREYVSSIGDAIGDNKKDDYLNQYIREEVHSDQYNGKDMTTHVSGDETDKTHDNSKSGNAKSEHHGIDASDGKHSHQSYSEKCCE